MLCFRAVLAVAGTVTEPTQEANQLGMQPVDTGFKHGLFAGFPDDLGYFFLCFAHHLFDAGGMDPAIRD